MERVERKERRDLRLMLFKLTARVNKIEINNMMWKHEGGIILKTNNFFRGSILI